MDPSEGSCIIEKELLRKDCYNKVLKKCSKYFSNLIDDRQFKVSMLVLRYIFNKNIAKTPEDDPVFIVSYSQPAFKQIQEDFKYWKIETDPLDFIDFIQELMKRFSKEVRKYKRRKTIIAERIKIGSSYFIQYGNIRLPDISNLGKINPYYALALQIRYNYLRVGTQNLAKVYNLDKSLGAEAFASSFNHYFDEYCSAFPDLEAIFGSKGSFFQVESFESKIINVNPPFDLEFMELTIDKVLELKKKLEHTTFILTFPHWQDMEGIIFLKKVAPYKIFKKGEIGFIDYMDNKRVIYPCEIIEFYLQSDQ